MGIQTATVLYPVNGTVVDSGTGIDIRLLDSAQAGADDDTQTVTATHTQDQVHRTFDPASTNNTDNQVGSGNPTFGYALRAVEDMTPTDDTNCNAVLTIGTLTVNIVVAVNQSGGVYVTATYSPKWRAALWDYDPVANTGVLIEPFVENGDTSWDFTPVTGDLGTFKNIALPIAIDPLYEFASGHILVLELGLYTSTIPNPTLGTATITYTLRVDNVNTNITFASGQGIRQVCYMGAAITGTGDAAGVLGIVLPTSAAITGDGTLAGVQGAIAQMSGTITGDGTLDGKQGAIAQMNSAITGSGDMSGVIAAVLGTVGTIDNGGGGGTTVHPTFGHFE